MNASKQDIKAMKIVQCLSDIYKYKILVMSQNKEIWLVNPLVEKFNVIRLSLLTTTQSEFYKEDIKKTRSSIASELKGEENLLEIYLSNENTQVSESFDKTLWVIGDSDQLPNCVAKVLPNLAASITKIEDPNLELKNLHQQQRKFRNKINKQMFPVVTISIIAVCIVIFALVNLILINNESFDSSSVAIAFGAYYQNFIALLAQYYRLVTAGFIHISFIHLLMNMLAFYNIGILLEKVLGKSKYFIVLILAIFGGSLFVWVTNGSELAIGLSGGIFGLLGVLIVYFIRIGALKNQRLKNQLISILLINLMISLQPNISWQAHLGGFIVGILAGIIIFYRNEKTLWLNSCIVSVVLFVGLLGYGGFNIKAGSLYPLTDYQVVSVYDAVGLDWFADNLRQDLNDFYAQNLGGE
ncbi:MAG: rhomboid family intramembrane serine protease [Erysipelotrichaceae bacterium]